MSKVAFLTSFKPSTPDPPAPKSDSYEKRLRRKRSPGRWQHLTTLTCRDFTKDTYDYRDTAPHLYDRGRFYKPCTAEANVIVERKDRFSRTELRHLNFSPGKLRADNRTVFPSQTVSSWTQLTDHSREVLKQKKVSFAEGTASHDY
mmetsp:Transcript_20853/g.38704  ORF Transcript_20853/g.38704 Transcript_20853/m.38704 type:complete len:146 (+) Transcript_20853:1-438(+)